MREEQDNETSGFRFDGRACGFFAFPVGTQAAQIKLGEVDIAISTTVSAGASMRVSEQSCEYISVFNGGCTAPGGTDYDVNSDDGNVNVERGEFISTPVKVISEADFKGDKYGRSLIPI